MANKLKLKKNNHRKVQTSQDIDIKICLPKWDQLFPSSHNHNFNHHSIISIRERTLVQDSDRVCNTSPIRREWRKRRPGQSAIIKNNK